MTNTNTRGKVHINSRVKQANYMKCLIKPRCYQDSPVSSNVGPLEHTLQRHRMTWCSGKLK